MEHMNFVLKLPLKEMALRRVAVNLWMETDSLAAMESMQCRILFDHIQEQLRRYHFDTSIYEKELPQIVKMKVKDKVSKFTIPDSLKKLIMHIVVPIGAEIMKWKLINEKILHPSHGRLDLHILKQLHWTCTGSVDYRKTAEELVRVKALDGVKLYKLACLYCLIDVLPVLWEELPNDYKENLNLVFNFNESEPEVLEIYWAHVMSGKQSESDCVSPIPCLDVMLDYSARKGYKEATIYFFERLKKEHKDLLMKTAVSVMESYKLILSPMKRLSDILCYLLTQMSPEQKNELLKSQAFRFLPCFLSWPMQDFFLDIADLTWTALPEIDYIKFLQLLIVNVKITGNYFHYLFEEFFVRSPHSFRKSLVHEEFWFNFLFHNFPHFEDAETFKTILRHMDCGDKVKLVCSDIFLNFLNFCMNTEEWTHVEFIICGAALSREDKDRFKNAFLECFKRKYPDTPHAFFSTQPQFKRFFDFLDETCISAVNKKTSEDDTDHF